MPPKPVAAPAASAPVRATPSPSRDRLLDRKQVEAIYGLSKRWLELAALRGDGPPMIRISRRMVRYRASDIEDWIDAHRVRSTSAQE